MDRLVAAATFAVVELQDRISARSDGQQFGIADRQDDGTRRGASAIVDVIKIGAQALTGLDGKQPRQIRARLDDRATAAIDPLKLEKTLKAVRLEQRRSAVTHDRAHFAAVAVEDLGLLSIAPLDHEPALCIARRGTVLRE